ncbi:ATP-grasp domain-containing protein [Halobellus salinisoli]|uniref:ATP-grasp domain-containing protein n=1 Tax=Halobellus salinisoli TaxID=3108500 RepID=UPI003008D55E
MTSIALATAPDLPDLVDDDTSFLAALREQSVNASVEIWSDESVAWGDFDAVLVRSIWDYYRHPEAFAAWIDRLETIETTVLNTPETLRWNRHKFYLRDLEARGVDTLPTAYLERGEEISLAAIFESRGWGEAVVKPAVSAGAFRTKRIARDDAADEQAWFEGLLADRDVLVQAFADGIGEGEWSLVFFDGEYSHSVLKRPKPGDFRVQEDHGGSVDAGTPSKSLRVQANEVVDAVTKELGGTVPLYARVDGITASDGQNRQAAGEVANPADFRLLEVELIEPELFFRVDDGSGDRLADALLDRL